MRIKQGFLVLAVILSLGLLSASGQAEIYKFKFDVWTTQYAGQPLQINFYFEIEDTALRPPAAVKYLKVYAPDGTVFDFSSTTINFSNPTAMEYKKCWQEWGWNFFFARTGANFKNTNKSIPSGTYKAVVVDQSGKTLTNSETFTVGSLAPPSISIPSAGATLTTLTPTFTWTAVPGAQYYRVLLLDETIKELIYSGQHRIVHVYQRFDPTTLKPVSPVTFPVPVGVLTPGRTYSLRVEARKDDKSLNYRSRSNWLTFKTATNAQ